MTVLFNEVLLPKIDLCDRFLSTVVGKSKHVIFIGLSFERPYLMQGQNLMNLRIMVRFI